MMKVRGVNKLKKATFSNNSGPIKGRDSTKVLIDFLDVRGIINEARMYLTDQAISCILMLTLKGTVDKIARYFMKGENV